MAKLSVIIPMYKTGSIIKKTIKSIENQSFEDFECLMIDDGSNDPSLAEFCQQLERKDQRFLYIYKNNEGIEKTRIFGVKQSTTNLLIFCDHDDYYASYAFETLYQAYLRSGADVVAGNVYSQRLRFVPFRQGHDLFIAQETVVERSEFITNYYKNFFGINVFHVSTWGKLYSKHLFQEELKCFGYNFFEDTVLNVQIFSRVNKVHFIKEFLYTHIYGGLSSRFDVSSVLNGYIDIYNFRNDLLKATGMYYKLNKYLLIEFVNVVNQNAFLMVENGFKREEFIAMMITIDHSDIFNDCINSDIKKGELFELVATGDYNKLYNHLLKDYTFKKRLFGFLKRTLKKLNS